MPDKYAVPLIKNSDLIAENISPSSPSKLFYKLQVKFNCSIVNSKMINMNFIKKITVNCIKQQDLTGSDDLHFFINNNFIGRANISSGETKSFEEGSVLAGGGPIVIDVGEEVRIEEFDIVDSNEVLFKHEVTKSDIADGSFSDTYTLDANYVFTLFFA